MKKELQDKLLEYMGELMYERDNCFDWIEQDQLSFKINAINVLLGIESTYESFMYKVREGVIKL